MTKAALALGLEKSIFVCAMFKMDTQLHIQAYHNICNFYSCIICTELINEHGTSLFYVNIV